jgi:crotonobetainyl-CoA:carnitine CoA-transferase CaiB-like acyl-CoA transferase
MSDDSNSAWECQPGAPKGPLGGVRVVDLTWMLAGPYCTMLLADLGADVIKVESPTGDPMRQTGPFPSDDELRAYGGYFQSINRNKRSLVLDLKSDDGHASLLKLIDTADVVVENFRTGVMDRLGLSYEALAQRKPRLVYASIRGFGDPRTGESPYSARPAVDVTIQAMAGMMGITGPGEGQPLKAGPGVGDIFPGTLCALGITSALLHARATGAGQYVDVAMYDGILSLCERIVYQHSYTGEIPIPQGNGHPLFCPFDIFPSLDGHVAIDASADRDWVKLARSMGVPALATDPRFAAGAHRAERAAEVREIVRAWTGARTSAEVVDILSTEVPVGAVNTIRDIFADPHVAARDMIVELEHPGSKRSVSVAGVPIKFTETPGTVRLRAPLLGEHSESILAGLEGARVEGRVASDV